MRVWLLLSALAQVLGAVVCLVTVAGLLLMSSQ